MGVHEVGSCLSGQCVGLVTAEGGSQLELFALIQSLHLRSDVSRS